jgi:hypothetical protein
MRCGRPVAMGVGVRVGVIVGVGRYHGRMLYCNIWEVYQAAPTSPRIKASPANSPTIDSTTDPST